MPYENDYFTMCADVYIVLKNKDDKVFMMRRKGTSWMSGVYNVPAGRVERNETIIQAAIRKVKDEAGVDVAEKDLKLFLISNRYKGMDSDAYSDWLGFYYIAENWQGTPHVAEPHKCDAADWYAIEDQSIKVIPCIRDAFNYMKENKLCYGLHSPEHDYFKKKVA